MMDLEEIWFEMECPACRYQDNVQMREVRLESYIWCHNCKQRIHLQDAEASVDDAKKQIDNAMNELHKLFKKIK